MTPGVRLRSAGADDLGFLYHVYASTRADELAMVDWDDAQKAAFLAFQFRAQSRYYAQQFPGASFDVIEHRGQAIGRFYVQRGETEIRVIDIALLPEHRGRGIGTALLRRLLDEAAATGRRVSLHVERFNPAIRLYGRLGFTPVGAAGLYTLLEWRPGGRRVDQPKTAS